MVSAENAYFFWFDLVLAVLLEKRWIFLLKLDENTIY